MYIAEVPNRSSPPAFLLRESVRVGKKVKSRTLANVTHWSAEKIGLFRRVMAGDKLVALTDVFTIERSLPHGHVAAVLGTLRRLGLDRILAAKESRERSLVLAMIVARIINPRSKLATARGLGDETAFSSLGETLGLGAADSDELYEAMDWLLKRQSKIEQKLAAQHLADGSLVLYDVSSTYFEGRHCPLAKYGHSRDGKKAKLQIVFGLLCNAEGCPVAVEVFEGNTADPKTLSAQIRKVKENFKLTRVVWVGDRGMITEARIDEELRDQEGVDWITALRAPAIRTLAEQGAIPAFGGSLFDQPLTRGAASPRVLRTQTRSVSPRVKGQRDLAEITSPDYPGERLIACRNPLLAEERKRTRKELIEAAEKKLNTIVTATQRAKRPLRGAAAIGLRVGKVWGRSKVAKYFTPEIAETSFSYARNAESIGADEAIDGIYVIRTSVKAVALDAEAAKSDQAGPGAPRLTLDAEGVVRAYKGLSKAERAFRSYKTVDLKVRPIHHRLANRVRAHVFLCMLAYYVEFHMRAALAPLLFDDEDKEAAEAQRKSIVAPAKRSPGALHKATTRRTADDLPVHSFSSLLEDLATLAKNRVRFIAGKPSVDSSPAVPPSDTSDPNLTTYLLTQPTPVQQRAFDLLTLSPTP